jgi:6-phosphogluconolactonase (cycloisomerase 2 family)
VLPLPESDRLVAAGNGPITPITTLDVQRDGALSLLSSTPPVGGQPAGLATNPEGTLLYISGIPPFVAPYRVEPDGSITSLPLAAMSCILGYPGNGIAYLRLPKGDFVYANCNSAPNAVDVFHVNDDGTLSEVALVYTGGTGNGGSGSLNLSGHTLRISTGGRPRLFVFNGVSNDVSVFDIGPNGTPVLIAGALFPLPYPGSGLAVDRSGAFLYVGTIPGAVGMFVIDRCSGLLKQVRGSPFSTGVSPPARVGDVQVAPTGRFVVAWVESGEIALLQASHRALAPAPQSPFADPLVSSLAFDSEGSFLFAGHFGTGTTVGVYTVGDSDRCEDQDQDEGDDDMGCQGDEGPP